MRFRALAAAASALVVGLGACGSTSGADSAAVSVSAPPTSDPAPSGSSPSSEGSPTSAGAGAVDLATTPDCPTEGKVLDTAKVYIEHNATDADTGLHGLLGGEAWSQLCVWDPAGTLIFWVDPREQLDDLTVADFFFESREPPNDELSIAELRAAFPEGDYLIGGIDFEGAARAATATFTHAIPAQPSITDPPLVADADITADATVGASGVTVTWEPVTETIDGAPLTITAYEVIVTKDDHDDPNGRSRPVYDVVVGPDQTSLAVPDEFFESGVVYELEVLALEESGNQTIGLGFFATE